MCFPTSPSRVLLAGALLLAACALPSQAATFTVSNLNIRSTGSLRQAILDANKTPGADIITFAPGLTGTIPVSSTQGTMTITDSVQIKGPGADKLVLDGSRSGIVQVLSFSAGTSTLYGVTVANGNYYSSSGGALANASGSSLALSQCIFRGNKGSQYSGLGGAIFNGGAMTISDCSFENNSSHNGGAIYNSGTLSAANSTFDANSVKCWGRGGPSSNGGFTYVFFAGHGSAIYNGSVKNPVLLTNCTFNNNTVTGTSSYGRNGFSDERSGALYNASGSLSLVNCTLSGNTDARTDIAEDKRVGTLVNMGTLSCLNTVFVDGGKRPFFGFTPPPSAGDARKNFLFANAQSAGLGALQSNGGSVKTLALAPTSPLLDKGLTTGALTTDARGVKRPQLGGVDVGAFELEGPTCLISANSPSVREGNGGTGATPSKLVFTLSLSKASTSPVMVWVQSANASTASATAKADYIPLGKTRVTFAPGQNRQTVALSIIGDTTYEENERVALVLSSPVGGALATTTAEGTILNDDALPSVSINDASVQEGNNPRAYTKATFTVSLSNPSDRAITVGYSTYGSGRGVAMGGTPTTADVDYLTVTGTLTFAPGQTSKTILVYVKGDTLVETNEIFGVRLSAPVNARIADAIGIGTILNDDGSTTTASSSAGAS